MTKAIPVWYFTIGTTKGICRKGILKLDKKEIDDVFDALQNPMEQIVKDIDLLFSENGIIKRHKQDYSPRESQIEASKKIMETLVQRGHAILEGPCGFGKTFAYLVPVFMDIIHSAGRPRTIIVTSGISLQEQLFYKDIPFIEKLILFAKIRCQICL